jgi:xylulokinase
MTAAHTKAHFARAIFEGTSFAMRDVIDRLDELGVSTDRIRALGGGAASEVWTQIRADLTGKVVEGLEEGDSSAMGAAALALVAAGDAPDVRSACERADLPLRRVEPISANRAVYDQSYSRYRTLFTSLEPMFT